MVKVTIYSACLNCGCPSYKVAAESVTHAYPFEEMIETNDIITCKHERVCKFIDGQEPIEIGE